MRPMHHAPEFNNGGDEIPHLIIGALVVLFWAAVIYGLVVLISKHARSQGWSKPVAEDPLAVAKLRYAKGEITKNELDEIKKTLQ